MQTYPLKFVLVGESRVGKTQLARSFMGKEFKKDAEVTINMEFSKRILAFEKCYVKALIWDTAGQERFESMSKHYYRDAVGAVLVYDICSKSSFESMKTTWLNQLRNFGDPNMGIILVGNKLDQVIDDPGKREVSIEEAVEFASQENFDFIEVSAFSGAAVEIAFRRLIFSVAKLIPDIVIHLDLNGLPIGWIICPYPQVQRAQQNVIVSNPISNSLHSETSVGSALAMAVGSSSSGDKIDDGLSHSSSSSSSSGSGSGSGSHDLGALLNRSGSDNGLDSQSINDDGLSLSRSRRSQFNIELTLTGTKDSCTEAAQSSPRKSCGSADDSAQKAVNQSGDRSLHSSSHSDLPDRQDSNDQRGDKPPAIDMVPLKSGVKDEKERGKEVSPRAVSNPSTPREGTSSSSSSALSSSSSPHSNSSAATVSGQSSSPPSAAATAATGIGLSVTPKDLLLKKSFSATLPHSHLPNLDRKPVSRAVSYNSKRSSTGSGGSSHSHSNSFNSNQSSPPPPPPPPCGYMNYWSGEVQVECPTEPAALPLLHFARKSSSLKLHDRRLSVSTVASSSKTLSLRDPSLNAIAQQAIGEDKKKKKKCFNSFRCSIL